MKLGKTTASVLVCLWIFGFHYVSLQRGHSLPLPAAAWKIHSRVEPAVVMPEVYRIIDGRAVPLEREEYFSAGRTPTDALYRRGFSSILIEDHAPDFCRHLQGRFPESEGFVVARVEYPDLVNVPQQSHRLPLYRCGPGEAGL